MICQYCNRDKGDVKICPFCHNKAEHLLSAGTVLGNRYIIESVSDENDTAIVYSARDHHLDKPVTVTEYFPRSYCERKSIVKADGFVCISYFRLPADASLADYRFDDSYQQYRIAEVACTDRRFDVGMERLLSAAKTANSFGCPVTDICRENRTVYLITERLDPSHRTELMQRIRAVCSGESIFIASFVKDQDADKSRQEVSKTTASVPKHETKPKAEPQVVKEPEKESFQGVMVGQKKSDANQTKTAPKTAGANTQMSANNTASEQAAAAKESKGGEYGGIVKLLAILVFSGTLCLDYLILVPKRAHWLAFDLDERIAIIVILILLNVLSVVVLRKVYTPYLDKKRVSVIVGAVIMAVYLGVVIPAVWQWDENPAQVDTPAKITVTETDDNAKAFQAMTDDLFESVDLTGYQYNSYYFNDGANYKSDTAQNGNHYDTELKKAEHQDCQLDSEVTIDSMTITIGKTTVQELLDYGFTKSIDMEMEANSEKDQSVYLYTAKKEIVYVSVSKTGDDPYKAVIQEMAVFGSDWSDSAETDFSYHGVSLSDSISAVVDHLGSPSTYSILSMTSEKNIELTFYSFSSDADIRFLHIRFAYDASSKEYKLDYFSISK